MRRRMILLFKGAKCWLRIIARTRLLLCRSLENKIQISVFCPSTIFNSGTVQCLQREPFGKPEDEISSMIAQA